MWSALIEFLFSPNIFSRDFASSFDKTQVQTIQKAFGNDAMGKSQMKKSDTASPQWRSRHIQAGQQSKELLEKVEWIVIDDYHVNKSGNRSQRETKHRISAFYFNRSFVLVLAKLSPQGAG